MNLKFLWAEGMLALWQLLFLWGRQMDEMWDWRVSKTQISRELGKNRERGIKK